MTDTDKDNSLAPRLIVKDVDDAMAFYSKVLGATRLERFTDSSGRVVHAAMQIGNSIFSMAQEVIDWGLAAPGENSDATVLLHLTVPDPDEKATAMVDLGGEVIIEIEDRPYGKREGRVRDPFGHVWILSKNLEDLTSEQIERRLGG